VDDATRLTFIGPMELALRRDLAMHKTATEENPLQYRMTANELEELLRETCPEGRCRFSNK